MSPIQLESTLPSLDARHPADSDRDALAALLLDGYRNTIDDEGEDLDDAYAAIDQYLARIERPHSYVVLEHDDVIAFSFVVVVRGVHYVDPVVVSPARKQSGLGRATVQRCLGSLAAAGIFDVGAAITDGNVASERLFTSLGFDRRGAWS
jgi:L-amino acid N-acyltransferase YncA